MSGLLATCAMSMVMLAGRKTGFVPKLPPKKITEKAARATLGRKVPEPLIDTVAIVAHFGYDATAGGLFGLLPPVRARTTQGVAYGLLIWAASYKGWVPALGIMPPPEKDDPGRAWAILISHIVYGATLGRCDPVCADMRHEG